MMTTKPSIWTDTPPKEPGSCYVKGRHSGLVFISNTAQLRDPEHYQFGQRIPSAEELAATESKFAKLNERIDALEAENMQYRNHGAVILVGPNEMKEALAEIDRLRSENAELRAAAAELAEIKRAWGMK